MRRTREQWAAVVTAFEKTSQPLEHFCANRGIAPATLRWWRWQLRHTAAARSNGVRLLPVDVVGANAARPGSALVIKVSDIEVRFDVGTDVDYVTALVGCLRDA